VNDRLWAALSEVQDPEMPVNLVDLGVIYGIDEHDGVVEVDLTFTAMGCPARRECERSDSRWYGTRPGRRLA
jgi:metal-sulfur cluster biosynthetic enzyme